MIWSDSPASGSLNWDDADILAVIGRWAELTPQAPALVEPGVPALSYAGAADATRSVAAGLTSLGIGRGDRVAVVADNDIAGAVLLLSLMGAAVCCPVNPAWTGSELAAYFDVVRPRAIVLPERASPAVEEVGRSAGLALLRARRGERPGNLTLVPEWPGPGGTPTDDDPARATLILRTSGTTAAGKVVPLTMGQVIAAAAATVRAYRLTAADRRLNVMPLFHVQGAVGSLAASLLCGSSLLCLGEFEPAGVLAALAAGGVTWFSATAVMHRLLLAAGAGQRTGSSLRFIRCGSGALDGRLRDELARAYGVPVIESYGMSEAHQIASTPLPPSPAAAGMVPAVTTIGFRTDTGLVATEPGARGEVVIKGPNVIDQYLWPPEAAASFIDGWLRTGDLGSMAADGSLVLAGRVKELINRGGEKFSPDEVESALLGHPGVREAVVFPVPHPSLGEQAAAAVVRQPGADVDERQLRAYLTSRVARYKLPARIVSLPSIPVGPAGKVVRRTLAATLSEQLRLPESHQQAAAARGRRPVELAVARLWAAALEQPRIGADLKFATLGGDERVGRVLTQSVREVFGVEVDPGRLFDDLDTARAMAGFIAAERGAPGDGLGSRRRVL